MKRLAIFFMLFVSLLFSCSSDSTKPDSRVVYTLDDNAKGVIETVNNIVNMTVVSNDANDLKAEYRAGFIQGKLQNKLIISARDNFWDSSYLVDPSHSFPKQIGPTPEELKKAEIVLRNNYDAFIEYLRNSNIDDGIRHKLKRLLFKMLGIYHGATLNQPAGINFNGTWLPDSRYFTEKELTLGYETMTLSFMDLYYLNAYMDLMDVLSFSPELEGQSIYYRPDKCSAFIKRTDREILITHNSWTSYLSQTMTQTYSINGDMVTMNAISPGQIGSNTDFGYNNKGIIFNETTHRVSRNQPKPNGIYLMWRATLAETFASSIDDFFRYISIDNTGTYSNGYMLIDAKNNETGLVEMSYRCFIFYRSTGGEYGVTSLSMDSQPCSTDYDREIVTPQYIMGINYPASYQVANDLGSTDNRPARKRQFKQFLPNVKTVEDAKALITYTDPKNPLSIFGRWDLGYGETSYPKMIPDGSIDAKAASTTMALEFMKLKGKLNLSSDKKGFWMLFGTPYVNGEPFIWSKSSWKWVKLRDVPDRLDGQFTWFNLYLE